jgi:hypothetical protein
MRRDRMLVLVGAVLLAVSVATPLAYVHIVAAGPLQPTLDPGRNDDWVEGPGPGRGAWVVYDKTDGSIESLIIYPLVNPGSVPLKDGQGMVNATEDPSLPTCYADARDGHMGDWYVDLSTLLLRHR